MQSVLSKFIQFIEDNKSLDPVTKKETLRTAKQASNKLTQARKTLPARLKEAVQAKDAEKPYVISVKSLMDRYPIDDLANNSSTALKSLKNQLKTLTQYVSKEEYDSISDTTKDKITKYIEAVKAAEKDVLASRGAILQQVLDSIKQAQQEKAVENSNPKEFAFTKWLSSVKNHLNTVFSFDKEFKVSKRAEFQGVVDGKYDEDRLNAIRVLANKLKLDLDKAIKHEKQEAYVLKNAAKVTLTEEITDDITGKKVEKSLLPDSTVLMLEDVLSSGVINALDKGSREVRTEEGAFVSTVSDTEVNTYNYLHDVDSFFNKYDSVEKITAIKNIEEIDQILKDITHFLNELETTLVTGDNYNQIVTGLKAIETAFYNHKAIELKNSRREGTGVLFNSPHLELLCNITKDGKGGLNFEFNENVLAALDFSLHEILAQSDLRDRFTGYVNDHDLASEFGLNEDTLSTTEKQQLRDVRKQYGTRKEGFAALLGRTAMKNLGLVKGDKATRGFQEKVAMGLGLFMVQWLIADGVLTETKFNPKEWSKQHENQSHVLTYPHTFIKLTKGAEIAPYIDRYLGKRGANNKRAGGGLKDTYKRVFSHEKTPRTSKESMPSEMSKRGTEGLSSIPAYVKKVLGKLWNTPYKIDTELAEYVLANRHFIEQRLGVTDSFTLDLLSYDAAASAEGVNLSIATQLDYLEEYTLAQKELEALGQAGEWYFDWFMSRNGRLFIDSNTLNPQTGKTLTRFLCLPSKIHRTFNPNSTKDKRSEAYAIAQAFDLLKNDNTTIDSIGEAFNKLTETQLLALREDLVHLSKDAFSKKWSKVINDFGVANKELKLGIENFGQCLNVLQHLIRKKQADGKSFETWLAIENDSTTSGYFIRFMEFPVASILDKFLSKVGVLTKKDKYGFIDMHELKAQKDFLDIYKTTAKTMAEVLGGIVTSNGKIKSDINQEALFEKSRVDSKDISLAFEMMYEALPKPDKDGGVSGDLRTLMKDPTMTYGYGAGELSIGRNLADIIGTQFINTYMEVMAEGSLKEYENNHGVDPTIAARVRTMEHIAKKWNPRNPSGLHQFLKKHSVSEVFLNITDNKGVKKKISLDKYFYEVLNPIYGKSVYKALDKSFGEHTPYNQAMSDMVSTMFKLLSMVMESKLRKVTKANGMIAVADYDRIVGELKKLFPTIPLAYSDDLDSGMFLMGTEKQRDTNSRVANPSIVDGHVSTDNAFAEVKKLAMVGTGKAGAVIPIHFIDGMGMAMLLDKFPNVIPVHDAVVMSAMDGVEITQKYNRDMVALAKEYNVFDVITNRFLDVYKEAQKYLEDINIDDIILKDTKNKFKLDKSKTPLTIKKFIEHVLELDQTNTSARKAFFSSPSPIYVTNMDGEANSGVTLNLNTLELSQELFKEALEEEAKRRKQQGKDITRYSDPNGYITTGEVLSTLQEATESVEGRMKLFDHVKHLGEVLGNKIESITHERHLRSLYKRIAPEKYTNVKIQYAANRPFTSGESKFNPDTKESTIIIGFDSRTGSQIDSVTRLSPLSGKSPLEVLVHESLHHAMQFTFSVAGIYKFEKQINQLRQIQKRAAEIIKPEDLMPTTYDKALESVYKQEAQKLWDYMFNNPDPNDAGLMEFVVHAMTNEKVMAVLSDPQYKLTDSSANNIGKPQNLLQKLLVIGKLLLDVVFGDTKVMEAFPTAWEILKGNVPIRQQETLYKAVDKLMSGIIATNDKAGLKLFNIPARPVEMAFSAIGKLRELGDNFLSPKFQFAFNWIDETGKTFIFKDKYNISGNWFDELKMMGDLLVGAVFSSSRRDTLMNVVLPDILGRSQQGALLCALRDMSVPDIQTSRLSVISALTRMAEQAAKGIESNITTHLDDMFGKKGLTEEADISLTNSLLYTDLQCLYDGTNLDYIKKLLTDKSFLSQEVNDVVHLLRADKNGKWYINQARGLARFMVTGIGNEAQNLNARNIARGVLLDKPIDASDETIQLIDKLATLIAIQLTDSKYHAITASLKEEGLDTFLRLHQQFVKETREGKDITKQDAQGNIVTERVNTISQAHMVKGYTKQLLDTSYDIKWDLASNENKMRKEGYIAIRSFMPNAVTKNHFTLYRRSFAIPNRRDGAAIIATGQHNLGTSLKDTTYELMQSIDELDKDALTTATWQAYKDNANKLQKKLIKTMQSKEMSLEEISSMSSGYTPIINPVTNEVSDYRITMSTENKINDLFMNMSGKTILGKMYASQHLRFTAKDRNLALVNWLKGDMRNMNSNKRDRYGHKYIKIEKDTDNKFLRNSWALMPPEFLRAAREGNFYIREDWLQDIFGVPNMSLANLKALNSKYAPVSIKRYIAIAEYIIKAIAYATKQFIVIKVPQVLLSNIASNIMVSVANGANPIRVIKETIANAKAIQDYIDTKKQLNRIILKERIGTATEAEIKSKNWYRNKLENNRVHPLMEKGMYGAITEDIKASDMETIGKINKFAKNLKVLDKIPNWAKNAVRQVYLGEGTVYYEFMRQLTQYSDFAARATEYQLQMEKAPNKWLDVVKNGIKKKELNPEYENYEEQLTFRLWNTFINYDKPQSALLQYLNDMGLAMFTKYALRIQHVIRTGILRHPIGVLMALLGQMWLIDVEDIYEQNIFNKHWSALIRNPVQNLFEIAIPLPMQYAFDMR